jgi:hypothetical protein
MVSASLNPKAAFCLPDPSLAWTQVFRRSTRGEFEAQLDSPVMFYGKFPLEDIVERSQSPGL